MASLSASSSTQQREAVAIGCRITTKTQIAGGSDSHLQRALRPGDWLCGSSLTQYAGLAIESRTPSVGLEPPGHHDWICQAEDGPDGDSFSRRLFSNRALPGQEI
mmetsp:Transcript_108778/g.192384  ORF Transcript_108778/g.192384 Transcript_108778/m.192384 type:complete len:105 (+) Transcript_108778:336-650(+)